MSLTNLDHPRASPYWIVVLDQSAARGRTCNSDRVRQEMRLVGPMSDHPRTFRFFAACHAAFLGAASWAKKKRRGKEKNCKLGKA